MTHPHDPAPETGSAPAPMRGWVKLLLFVSLALNLVVVGIAAGAVLRHGDMKDRSRTRVEQIGGPYTTALSREDRRAIWREMRDRQGEGRPSRTQIREEFDAVVAALRADPYDPTQVRDIVERQFQAGLARQQLGQSLLLERIESMSPDERAGFADRLSERMQRWREGGPTARPDNETE